MLHGYGGSPGPIELEVERRGGRDRDPIAGPRAVHSIRPPVRTPIRPRRREAIREGGMGVGVHLLRTMMDEVHHAARPDGGNELTLVRSIDDPGEED